jgi:hypothetical protein
MPWEGGRVLGYYDWTMPKKPLIETNPYLRDPAKYRKGLIANVSSSTSVETGKKTETIARTLSQSGEAPRLKKQKRSGR